MAHGLDKPAEKEYNSKEETTKRKDFPMAYREEQDSLGTVLVSEERLWGAQTQRSLENFPIGQKTHRMPQDIIAAFAHLKAACAAANRALVPQRMTEEKASAILGAAEAILQGELWEEFPLVVYQTGSGTQTNMNANEVIAAHGNRSAGAKLLHPNDDVNMSQSSNDTYPSALHIAAVLAVRQRLFPALDRMIDALGALAAENADVLKSGRTHLMDATPITFGQEVLGWQGSLMEAKSALLLALPAVRRLAIGGTAVGTGLNAPRGFDEAVCRHLTEATGASFIPHPNKFHALTSQGELVTLHGAVKALAMDLYKIASDVRLLASGPRTGIGEISLPENEPGSSIMPGKVNPTQCEAVTMVAARVMGNDATLAFAAAGGQLELNVMLPVMAEAFLDSVHLLGDVLDSFRERCVSGIRPRTETMRENLEKSLMLVTALTPKIGYEAAAKIARHAHEHGLTLKEAALALGTLTEEEFDAAVKPETMV